MKYALMVALAFWAIPGSSGAIQVSSDALDFGVYYIGEALPVRSLTITNDHPSDDLEIVDFQFSGSDADCFRVIGTSGTTQMASGETLTVMIQFTPSRMGDHSATYTIVSNDAASPEMSISLAGTQAEYPDARWIFYFLDETVVLDCPAGADLCQANVGFEAAPPLGSDCGGSPTPLAFAQAVAGQMQLTFAPCTQMVTPDLIGDPSYGMIYETRYGRCDSETRAKCVLAAAVDPASVTLTGNDCRVTGKIRISASGEQNIANCTNYTYTVVDASGDPVTIETGRHFFLMTHATALFPQAGGVSYPDGITIAVTGSHAEPAEDYTDLAYCRAAIRVMELDGMEVVFELRFKDATGSFVALPSNVAITQIEWTVDGSVAWSSLAPAGLIWPDYTFTDTEHTIRALVHLTFDPGSGAPPINVLLKSNELRLTIPNPGECTDGSVPTAHNIPPILRPENGPDRAIFSNVTPENVPDYGRYTGTGDLTHIPLNYWTGGAAKGGIWGPWIDDDNTGRVGRRSFTFVSALPWDVFALCPVADVALPDVMAGPPADLPGDGFVLLNACVDPNNLLCPVESDGTIAWNLAWTPYGWLCLRHACILQEDNTTNVNQGEARNCDE